MLRATVELFLKGFSLVPERMHTCLIDTHKKCFKKVLRVSGFFPSLHRFTNSKSLPLLRLLLLLQDSRCMCALGSVLLEFHMKCFDPLL